MEKQHVKITMVFEEPIGQAEEDQIREYLEGNFEPEKIYISYEDYED